MAISESGPFAGRGPEVWEWLKRAGIAKDDERVQRVVIDIDVNSVVKVYVEKLASGQMLMVEPLDFSRNVTVVDKPDDTPPFNASHVEWDKLPEAAR